MPLKRAASHSGLRPTCTPSGPVLAYTAIQPLISTMRTLRQAAREGQHQFRVRAFIALLEKIGPAIMLPHSSPGPETWQVADARPDLVAAIVSDEPSGPPFFNVNLVTGAQGALTRPWGPSVGPLAYEPPVSDPIQLYNVCRAAVAA